MLIYLMMEYQLNFYKSHQRILRILRVIRTMKINKVGLPRTRKHSPKSKKIRTLIYYLLFNIDLLSLLNLELQFLPTKSTLVKFAVSW